MLCAWNSDENHAQLPWSRRLSAASIAFWDAFLKRQPRPSLAGESWRRRGTGEAGEQIAEDGEAGTGDTGDACALGVDGFTTGVDGTSSVELIPSLC